MMKNYIDWEQVAQLRRDVGADGFEEIIEVFLDEVEEKAEELRVCSPDTALEEHLHFLKGSAKNVGFDYFSELCASAEREAMSRDSVKIDIPHLLEAYNLSKAALLSELPKRF
ncbi:MAG: Hpt domain-containing protein [Pseudomonadota bacterium]